MLLRRITVESQPRQIVPQDPILKKLTTKKGLTEWPKVSSNPSTAKKKKKNKTVAKLIRLNQTLQLEAFSFQNC
jgi:hypothetical protein